MKFRVMMKDPDTLIEAVQDAVNEQVKGIADEAERDAVRHVRETAALNNARRWFKYSEYLTVEIDTEANTATVCEVE